MRERFCLLCGRKLEIKVEDRDSDWSKFDVKTGKRIKDTFLVCSRYSKFWGLGHDKFLIKHNKLYDPWEWTRQN